MKNNVNEMKDMVEAKGIEEQKNESKTTPVVAYKEFKDGELLATDNCGNTFTSGVEAIDSVTDRKGDTFVDLVETKHEDEFIPVDITFETIADESSDRSANESANSKLFIEETYESEVKVFNLDAPKFIKHLDGNFFKYKEGTEQNCEYQVQIWKDARNNKVKFLIYKDEVFMQHKDSVGEDGITAKIKIEKTVRVNNIDQAVRDLRFLGYKLVYNGIKDRTTWRVSPDLVITHDKWIAGPIAGVEYFEIENSNEKVTVDYAKMINEMLVLVESTKAYSICINGTMTVTDNYTNKYLKSADDLSFGEWVVTNPMTEKTTVIQKPKSKDKKVVPNKNNKVKKADEKKRIKSRKKVKADAKKLAKKDLNKMKKEIKDMRKKPETTDVAFAMLNQDKIDRIKDIDDNSNKSEK